MTEKRYVMKPHNVYNVFDTKEYEPLDILDCCNELNALHEENQHIRNTIQTAYKNERTSLGRSVLKQLMESLK